MSVISRKHEGNNRLSNASDETIEHMRSNVYT